MIRKISLRKKKYSVLESIFLNWRAKGTYRRGHREREEAMHFLIAAVEGIPP